VTIYKIVFNIFNELRYSRVFQNKCILGSLESVLLLLFELTYVVQFQTKILNLMPDVYS